jgi:hypothetical protein
MNEATLLGARLDPPLQFLIAIALAAAYLWAYESWLSDDAASSQEGPFLVAGGAGIALTPRQQATRRRWAIVPALLVLCRGTDFRLAPVNAVILVSAGLAFAVLILVPEPRE